MVVKRGDIFIADLGENEGCEQRGRRPVLIIQNDVGNHYSPTVIVASITDANKRYMPTHVLIDSPMRKKSVVLLEQIRTIDKCKLMNKAGTISETTMKKVDDKLKVSLGLVPVTTKGGE